MSAEIALTPSQKRAFAIALLLVPVALVLLIAAPVFSGYQDHRDHMAVLARNYLSYQAAIADAPAERAAIARFRESRTLNDLVLPSQQASLAVAQLQSTISQIAAAAGARVIQSASQIQAPDGALIELSAHITLEPTWRRWRACSTSWNRRGPPHGPALRHSRSRWRMADRRQRAGPEPPAGRAGRQRIHEALMIRSRDLTPPLLALLGAAGLAPLRSS